MSAPPNRHQAYLHTPTRLRHVAAALAIMASGLMAWAAATPAASAAALVIPDPAGGPYQAVPATADRTVRVITVGGMPGWQITLIAIAAALVGATAAVLLDRLRVGRQTASATG
jgi:hypothetical protein